MLTRRSLLTQWRKLTIRWWWNRLTVNLEDNSTIFVILMILYKLFIRHVLGLYWSWHYLYLFRYFYFVITGKGSQHHRIFTKNKQRKYFQFCFFFLISPNLTGWLYKNIRVNEKILSIRQKCTFQPFKNKKFLNLVVFQLVSFIVHNAQLNRQDRRNWAVVKKNI